MRKREQTAKRNERDFPHIVEVAIPANGWGNLLNEMLQAHNVLGIREYRGEGRFDLTEGRDCGRWCFENRQHADSFARAFGGKVISPP
jgi:hypothetical protein